MTVDLSALNDRRFDFYLRRPIPHPLDDEVRAVVTRMEQLTGTEREQTRAAVSLRASQVLNAYAERMAVAAVRRSDTRLLGSALVAIALAGAVDFRDNLMVLSLINHSAEMIGSSLEEVFSSVREVQPPGALARIEGFLGRSPRDKQIEVMGYSAEGTGAAFRYVLTPLEYAQESP